MRTSTSGPLVQVREPSEGALNDLGNDLGNDLDQAPEKVVGAQNYRTDFPGQISSPNDEQVQEILVPDQQLGQSGPDRPSPSPRARVFLGTTLRTETDAPEPPPAANDDDPAKAKPRRRKAARDDRRRHTTGLSISPGLHKQGREAFVNAGRSGAPLDTLVTIRPLDFLDLGIEDRWTWTKAKINALRTWFAANDDRPEFKALWARESKRIGKCPDCTAEGEHLHVLLHAGEYRAELEAYLRKRLDGPELDVRPADALPRMLENGWIADAGSYLLKAASPQVYMTRRTIPHRPSGPIYGPRVGWTRNILDQKPVGRQARPRRAG